MEQHDNYHETFPYFKHLAELASEESGRNFLDCLPLLVSIINAWEKGWIVSPPVQPENADENIPQASQRHLTPMKIPSMSK